MGSEDVQVFTVRVPVYFYKSLTGKANDEEVSLNEYFLMQLGMRRYKLKNGDMVSVFTGSGGECVDANNGRIVTDKLLSSAEQMRKEGNRRYVSQKNV